MYTLLVAIKMSFEFFKAHFMSSKIMRLDVFVDIMI